MRGFLLLTVFIVMTLLTVAAAHAGALAWVWVALMYPHRETFGFVNDFRLNYYISIIALLVWLLGAETKIPKGNRLIWLCGGFTLFTALTTLTAYDPEFSNKFLIEFIKSFAMLYVVTCTINSRLRVHALVLMIFVSLSYWGVKGGGFGLTSGGGIIFGPPKSQFSDNNQLALVLVSVLPLAGYLFAASKNQITRFGVAVAAALTGSAILLTGSRGAFLAVVAMGGYWLITNRRFKAIAAAAVVLLAAYAILPSSWYNRMDTISSYSEDRSAQGRFDAWQTSFSIAKRDPLTGAGFSSIEIPQVYFSHNPESVLKSSKAAHSIWFEVMGDHGFLGLAFYLLIAWTAWRYLTQIQKRVEPGTGHNWVLRLVSSIKLSLIGFWAGGTFLSMAYVDIYFLLIALTGILYTMTVKEMEPLPQKRRSPYRFA